MHFKNILACLTLLSTGLAVPHTRSFVHPGALHTNKDIQRIKKYVKAEAQPWFRAWQHLQSMTLAQTTWVPKPHEVLVRGTNATWPPTPAQNYGDAYRDAHSAYQLTLRWLIGGNTSYADHAVEILNGWGSTLRDINGTEDKFLAAGLYGYQFANAAELLRVYPGWTKANQTVFANMLNDVFAKYNFDFLENHNYKTNFYYANWDLCNIASLLAIGIFNDNRTMYDYAAHYWQNGLPDSSVVVNGALPYFSIANFTEDSGKQLMEIQESGRDQGHATLCIALLGVIGQQGWNQGVDLFSTYQHEILHASGPPFSQPYKRLTNNLCYSAEYVAKYNTNHTVPYTPYTSWEGLLSVVADKGRFSVRPGYEAIASHYAGVKHMDASWSMDYRDYVNQNISAGVEGGGGDYGPNSGGYDTFGHGTLLYRIESDA